MWGGRGAAGRGGEEEEGEEKGGGEKRKTMIKSNCFSLKSSWEFHPSGKDEQCVHSEAEKSRRGHFSASECSSHTITKQSLFLNSNNGNNDNGNNSNNYNRTAHNN